MLSHQYQSHYYNRLTARNASFRFLATQHSHCLLLYTPQHHTTYTCPTSPSQVFVTVMQVCLLLYIIHKVDSKIFIGTINVNMDPRPTQANNKRYSKAELILFKTSYKYKVCSVNIGLLQTLTLHRMLFHHRPASDLLTMHHHCIINNWTTKVEHQEGMKVKT
jgi:hypothetical protein